MEPPPPSWQSFAEAKEAIAITPLRELEGIVGLPAPELLPFSGWALGLGLLVALLAGGFPPARLLGLMVAAYGAFAVATNRNRAELYRELCYRTWVRRRADEMADEADSE